MHDFEEIAFQQLTELKQTGTVIAYKSEFDVLALRAGVTPQQQMKYWYDGLKPDIVRDTRFDPVTRTKYKSIEDVQAVALAADSFTTETVPHPGSKRKQHNYVADQVDLTDIPSTSRLTDQGRRPLGNHNTGNTTAATGSGFKLFIRGNLQAMAPSSIQCLEPTLSGRSTGRDRQLPTSNNTAVSRLPLPLWLSLQSQLAAASSRVVQSTTTGGTALAGSTTSSVTRWLTRKWMLTWYVLQLIMLSLASFMTTSADVQTSNHSLSLQLLPHLSTFLLQSSNISQLHLIGFGLKIEDCCTLYLLKLKHSQVVNSHLMLLQMILVITHCAIS